MTAQGGGKRHGKMSADTAKPEIGAVCMALEGVLPCPVRYS